MLNYCYTFIMNWPSIFCTAEPLPIWCMWVQDIYCLDDLWNYNSTLFHSFNSCSSMLHCQNYNFVYKMSNYYQYIVECSGIMKEEISVCSEGGKGCGVELFRCSECILFLLHTSISKQRINIYWSIELPISSHVKWRWGLLTCPHTNTEIIQDNSHPHPK